MRIIGVLLVALLLPLSARAQTHANHGTAAECDTTPVSVAAANTGQQVEFGWCHDGKDTGGAALTTPLNWRVQRNDVTMAPQPVISKSPTANAAGLTYYWFMRSESSSGTYTFKVSATTVVASQTLESVVIPFASLLVASSGVLPAAVTLPRIVRP